MHARCWTSAHGAAGRPPIVLVHGLGVSSRYMVPAAERLAVWHDVFAPDLPGFGQSESPPEFNSIKRQAQVLGDWIDATGLRTPVLVGHSYGSQVVAELAMQRPSGAMALVLSAPTVENTRRTIIGEARRLVSDAPRERIGLLPIVVSDYVRAGPRRILFTLRDAIADRIEDKLPRMSLPTLFVRGARDPIVSARWIAFLAAQTRGASTVTLDRAAHAVNFGAAEGFAAAVINFVASIAPPAR
jgi:pimeloyl-ACP methyl ester carboxylesterase